MSIDKIAKPIKRGVHANQFKFRESAADVEAAGPLGSIENKALLNTRRVNVSHSGWVPLPLIFY